MADFVAHVTPKLKFRWETGSLHFLMYSANIDKRLRRLINPPTLHCINQKLQEFDPSPTLAMIYPTAVHHFMANAFYCVTPLYANNSSGGGGRSSTKRCNEQTPRPSQSSRKPRHSSVDDSKQRTSPRTANTNKYATPSANALRGSEEQCLRLGRGTNLNPMPPIQEIAVPQEKDDDNFSVDLLAETQHQASYPNKSSSSGSHVSGTQFPPNDDNAFLRKDDSSLSNAGSGTSSSQKPSPDPSKTSKSQDADDPDAANNNSPAKSIDSADNPYSDIHTEAASKYDFHTRLKHFLQGRVIQNTNREAVELVYLCEAGRIVVDCGRWDNEK